MDPIFLSIGYLVFGLAISFLVLLAAVWLIDLLEENRSKSKRDIAIVPRIGSWKYTNDYFDKITEFRNDVSRS